MLKECVNYNRLQNTTQQCNFMTVITTDIDFAFNTIILPHNH